MAGRQRSFRRARGFAPSPLKLPPGFEHAPDLLAMGGELKAAFCLLKERIHMPSIALRGRQRVYRQAMRSPTSLQKNRVYCPENC
jgi:hydrogenase maturation factor HypF (carbamoyltransferase family)